MRLVDRARLEARWDHGNAFCGRGETCSWRRCGAHSRVPQPPIALPGGQNTQWAGQPHHAEIILFIRISDYHINRTIATRAEGRYRDRHDTRDGAWSTQAA